MLSKCLVIMFRLIFRLGGHVRPAGPSGGGGGVEVPGTPKMAVNFLRRNKMPQFAAFAATYPPPGGGQLEPVEYWYPNNIFHAIQQKNMVLSFGKKNS